MKSASNMMAKWYQKAIIPGAADELLHDVGQADSQRGRTAGTRDDAFLAHVRRGLRQDVRGDVDIGQAEAVHPLRRRLDSSAGQGREARSWRSRFRGQWKWPRPKP
jgi:hypothetical protein